MMLLSPSEAPESLFHEVATIFPPMGEEEFHHFVTDIRQRGLLEPIWTYQGKIIDGIHRYRACRLIGIEPTYREWDGQGSLVSFVVSLNWQRRHLTSSQKAMIALEIEALLAKEHPVGRPSAEKNGGTISTISGSLHPSAKSRDQAAALVGTNGHYVTDAKRIVVQAPELRTSVKMGELTIPEARTLAQLPAEQRVEAKSLLAAGTVRTAKAAVLEIKKAAIDAQAQVAPAKPSLALRSWEAWLPEQPPCDLLLTDPPYSTEVEDIEAFAHAWLPLALAKVKPTGRAYVFIGAYPQEMRAYLNVQACWPVQQILVWAYKNTLGPKPTWGYKQNWQAILSFSGPDAPPLDCPLLTEQFSVQEINAPDGRLGNRYHTWQKPEALAEQLIRHSTKPGDLVYDVFSGTGTFVLAAQRLGRIGLGCDHSEEMLLIAERRGCTIAR